jgi:hypothetical protein
MRPHDPEDEASQALIDVGILDRLAAFLNADEQPEIIVTACDIAARLMRRVNWKSGKFSWQVCKKALNLLVWVTRRLSP